MPLERKYQMPFHNYLNGGARTSRQPATPARDRTSSPPATRPSTVAPRTGARTSPSGRTQSPATSARSPSPSAAHPEDQQHLLEIKHHQQHQQL